MGRKPTENMEAIKERIASQLADGIPLREICRGAGMPAWRTVYDWMDADASFAASIARARISGFDAIAAQCLEIADTPLEGVETTTKPNGDIEEKRGDMLGHRKLQIETRLKLLAKWDPKRYGEKLAVGGADDLPAIKTSRPLADMSTEEIRAALEKLAG